MVTSGAPSAGLRVVSYGGGVQSTALLVLAAQGRVDFRVFLMANTGDDSEHPATLRYVRVVAVPVGTESACRQLTGIVDDVVCADLPTPFAAVGESYRDFDQVSDDEVRRLLR